MRVFAKFGILIIVVHSKDYHDFYLKTDVLLLADVFENIREMGMRYYGLDPAQYLTLPSYSWDSCLKYTQARLELIRDPEIYNFIESGIRGGVSTITHRYARQQPVFGRRAVRRNAGLFVYNVP